MKTTALLLGFFAALTTAHSHPRYLRFMRDNTTAAASRAAVANAAAASSSSTRSIPLVTGAAALPTNGTRPGITTITVCNKLCCLFPFLEPSLGSHGAPESAPNLD